MQNEVGIIFRIKKYAIHDGPGIRTTVFLKGCPLRCGWCHNPEGIDPDPEPMGPGNGGDAGKKTIGTAVAVSQVMAEIEKDTIFYDESGGGATFSGGEPLMQPAFLSSLLDGCRNHGIHTAVDTSGFASTEAMAMVAEKTDLILFDLKIMDEDEHRRHTGVSNKQVLENLKIVSESGTPVRIRFPLIPGITDNMENARRLAETIRLLGNIRHIDLLPFHPAADAKYRRLGRENPMAGATKPDDETIENIRTEFETRGFQVHLGG
jgi:pyruvate formate lyase activating enzyme